MHQVRVADKPGRRDACRRGSQRPAFLALSRASADQSVALPLRHPGQEMIVNEARDRHRRGERVGGREREAEVLEPQRHFESRRLVLLRDERSVGLVHRRREQRAVSMSR